MNSYRFVVLVVGKFWSLDLVSECCTWNVVSFLTWCLTLSVSSGSTLRHQTTAGFFRFSGSRHNWGMSVKCIGDGVFVL